MKDKIYISKDNTSLALREAIEGIALEICVDYNNCNKRIEDVMQECEILDSLTRALNAISPVH